MIFAALLLAGCGSAARSCTSVTGGLTYRCADSGVEYVQSESGLALHVSPGGQPVLCADARRP